MIAYAISYFAIAGML